MLTETDVNYYEGGDRLRGVLVRDPAVTAPRPGVIVFHEAWGLNDYVLKRARMLADLGYIAFAADVFGERRVMTDPAVAMPITRAYRAEPLRLRARALAAFDTLRAEAGVDAKRIGAIGYCFGGTTALELARSGVELAAVVSFHGTLSSGAQVTQPDTIKASILACTGADDPIVPATQVAGFQDEMTRAKADYQILVLGGAVHGFSNADAAMFKMPGLAYNTKADWRAWAAMRQLFEEAFV